MGLGDGVTAQVQDTFNSMGANVVSATVLYQNDTRYVDLDELEEFVSNEESISYFSPDVSNTSTIKFDKEDLTTSISGVSQDYAKIRDRGIAEGRNIQYIDVLKKQKVCLLGTYVVDELFGEETPYNEIVGKEVKINGYKFNVIGILEEKSGGSVGGFDDIVLIPYTVAQDIYNINNVNRFYFSYPDGDFSEEATEKIDKFFYNIFKETDYYIVIDSASMMDSMNDILDTITTVLVAIAAISLVVGGIGIMNIMLVSVSERTREIGVRKAIGANPQDILSQFVIEAITTSGIGGILGILLGIVMTYLVSGAMGLTASVSISSIVISAGVSCLIGVLFGYLPAKKAAKMNPIEALRHE